MTDTLLLFPAGIDTYRQPVVYMHEDCSVCRAEGFEAQSRVQVHSEGGASIVALRQNSTLAFTGSPDMKTAANLTARARFAMLWSRCADLISPKFLIRWHSMAS